MIEMQLAEMSSISCKMDSTVSKMSSINGICAFHYQEKRDFVKLILRRYQGYQCGITLDLGGIGGSALK